MTTAQSPATDTSDREVVISRQFNAPRSRVFEAWTSPEHLGHWFGPTGFTTTTHVFDMRPGGEWRFTMHGPDGTDYPNRVLYQEILPPERLVYAQDDGKENDSARFQVTVTFEEQDGGTLLTLRSVFSSKERRDYVVRTYRAIEGGKQTLARLAEFVER